jgi:heat shock protein HtpX
MSQIKKDRVLQLRMVFVMFMLSALGILFASTIGYIIDSIIFAVVLVSIFAVLQFAFGKKIAMRSMGANKVENDEYPELHSMVNNISQQANIPKPEVAVADTELPNAFAAGRSQDSSVVCVTTGLIKKLDDEELESVIAHEVAHIKNRDVIVMTVAGLITMLSGIVIRYGVYFTLGGRDARGFVAYLGILFVSILTYIVGYILIRALSRYREFAADRGSAQLTGNPTALAEALRKIDSSIENTPDEDLRNAEGASALMISPVKSKISSLLSTHPSTEKRIKKLNDISKDMKK